MTDRPSGEKCGSRKKQSEGTCGRPAGWGTSHPGFGRCKLHGGSSPNGEKHAERLEEAWRARLADGIDPALSKLESLREASVESVQLAATRDWLDRAGVRVGDEGAGDVTIHLKLSEDWDG